MARSRLSHDRLPAIGEILSFALEGEPPSQLRYLRAAQLRALETYWYLRLVEGTPRIPELYERRFTGVPDRLTALGLDKPALKDIALDLGYQGLIAKIATDDALAKTHRLEPGSHRGHAESA
ncbi:MAG: hypothetical protein WD628_03345 [Thermomicrobiales bacterium]